MIRILKNAYKDVCGSVRDTLKCFQKEAGTILSRLMCHCKRTETEVCQTDNFPVNLKNVCLGELIVCYHIVTTFFRWIRFIFVGLLKFYYELVGSRSVLVKKKA